jgi:hypothetical protein
MSQSSRSTTPQQRSSLPTTPSAETGTPPTPGNAAAARAPPLGTATAGAPAADGAAAAAAAAAAPPPAATTTIAAPRWLLLFDHRVLFDVSDADAVDAEAWAEALGAFGLAEINRAAYLESLAGRAEGDVMKTLCPFTTRAEWPSILNKRHVVLSREIADWCFANAVPVPGAADFLDACARELGAPAPRGADDDAAAPAAAAAAAAPATPRPGCLSLWLTPWKLEHARAALDVANLSGLVAPYTVQSTELALVQVLETFGLRPPVETPALVHSLAATQGLTVADVARARERLRSVVAATVNEREAAAARQEQSAPPLDAAPPTRVVVFVGSARQARLATSCGLTAVGVSYCSFDQEDDAGGLVPGCDDEQALLAAGCRVVIRDYGKMVPRYLKYVA